MAQSSSESSFSSSSSDNSDYSDDGDDEPCDELPPPPVPKDVVQELSMQWLDLKRVTDRLEKTEYKTPVESDRDLLKAIEAIIKIHNKGTPDKKPHYVEDTTKIVDDPDSYSSIFYTYTKSYTTSLAKKLQKCPENTKNSQHVLFYYKTNPRPHIIALSTSNAWRVVRPYADYTFPIKVAEKVINPKKMIQIVRKSLFQLNKQEELSHPSEYYLYPASNLYYLIENFKCEIKKDSDLYELIKKKNKKGEKRGRCWAKFTLGGNIRIGERLCFSDYPSIFDLFAQYMHTSTEKEEESSDVLQSLFFVEHARPPSEILDDSLLKHIYLYYIEKTGIPPNVHVRHTCLSDFLLCNTFQIKVNSKLQEMKTKPPELKEIVKIVHKMICDKPANEKYTEFVSKMTRGRLTFENRASEPVGEKIINCIEGEHQFLENTYFKIKKTWYEFRQDYIALLHQDFRNLVETALIKKSSEWWLHLPYIEKSEDTEKMVTLKNDEETKKKKKENREEIYNRLYLNSDDEKFLVFDQILNQSPNKIEPCDILKYTDDAVYLYHVKEVFGTHTREVCSQIFNAATLIKNDLLTFKPPYYLKNLWSQGTKGTEKEGADHWKNKLRSRLESLGEKEFYDIFKSRKIVFVYAHAPLPKKSFTRALAEMDREIDEKVIEKLKKSNFLNKHGRLTAKFFYTNKGDFRIDGTSETKSRGIYNQLYARQFYSSSTLAKIELVQLVHDLHKLNFELKICEIPRSASEPVKNMESDLKCEPGYSDSDSEPEDQSSNSGTVDEGLGSKYDVLSSYSCYDSENECDDDEKR